MFHHDCEEFDNDFRARPEKNLSFASLFSIVDGFEGITQNIHTHHGCTN